MTPAGVLLSQIAGVAFLGLAYGMVLYVISVGLSITMGLMGFVNLAHGVFAMTGGFILSMAMARLGIGFPLALLAAFLGAAVLGAAAERLLYARLYGAGERAQVLFTIALIFIAASVARLSFGTQAAQIRLPDLLHGQTLLFGRAFPTYRALLILLGCGIAGVLWFGIERTRWGAMVRASVDNRCMAQSVGIDTGRLFTLTFALGSGMAGLGGALGADILPPQWNYPQEHLVYFLIVVAVGGLGSLRGAFAAALLIGIADTACRYWAPALGAFVVYGATIALLLWRPFGLFGVARA